MDIRLLILKDFKSYRGEHIVKFPKEPGLYYLTGSNTYNSRLGRNGCGKTTLLDGICWALYGRTTRGLKANDVISWGASSCIVAVSVIIGDDRATITRTQKPNSLKLRLNGDEERSVEQKDIDALLRLSFDSFVHSIMLPQFGQSFFDLSPTEKLGLFSDIMALDHWLTKSAKAKMALDKTERYIAGVERALEENQKYLEHQRADLQDLKTKREGYAEEIKKRRKALEALLRKITEQEAEAEKLFTESDLVLKAGKKKLAEARAKVEAASSLPMALWKDITQRKATLSSVESGLDKLHDESRRVESLTGQTCPTCQQLVTKGHFTAHKKEILKAVGVAERKINLLTNEISQLTAQRKAALAEHQDLERKAENTAASLDHARKAHANNEGLLEATTRERKDIAKRLRDHEEQDNPFDDLIVKARKNIASTKAGIGNNEENLTQLRKECGALQYWVTGFKRVRLFIIEEAIRALEIEINNNLVSLGLDGWSIKLDVERENKSGGITKGFSVLVTSPKHSDPVRWEAWSGGESQRLSLAGDLGLANLILERAGLTGQIEFYDEPSEHLSTEGIDDLVTTLHDRAKDTGRKIWLVDHHAVDAGQFEQVFTAVMDKKGTTQLELS